MFRRNVSRGSFKEVNFEMKSYSTGQKVSVDNEKLTKEKVVTKEGEKIGMKDEEKVGIKDDNEEEGPYDWLSKMKDLPSKRLECFEKQV